MPWIEPIFNEVGMVTFMKCHVCSKIEKKNKVLVAKWDSIEKRARKRKTANGKWFMGPKCGHANHTTTMKNGTYYYWIWIVILDLKLWKGLTQSTPKQSSLEVRSSFYKPLCVIKKFMTNKVRLLVPYPKNASYTLNNKSMWHQSWTI